MNVNNYSYSNKLESFKSKLLDPQQKRVEEAEAIMNDPNYQWKDEDQKTRAKAQLEVYRAWYTYYKMFYDEGCKFALQHENIVNKMAKWYQYWYNNVSNEGLQEKELMSMQADALNEIFCEMFKELQPLNLDINTPKALNMK